MKKTIIVAGNIGVGKSTLVSMLGERLGWQPFYESVAENPYLADFYADMPGWAFHSQVFFLTERLSLQRRLIDHPASVIQDRSMYEDAEIFARNLYLQGLMNERDYLTYQSLYHALTAFLPAPDLVIYLRAQAGTLRRRILQRGREYERDIRADYLEQLNDLYRAWIDAFTGCPVLTVPADDLDFVNRPGHFELIARKVEEKLTGKEEVIFSPEEVEGDGQS